MVSPARPSRESITLSSMWAQKGHFTRGYLLSAGQLTKLIHIFEFAKFRSSYCNGLIVMGSFQCVHSNELISMRQPLLFFLRQPCVSGRANPSLRESAWGRLVCCNPQR